MLPLNFWSGILKIIVREIELKLEEPSACLQKKAAEKLGVDAAELRGLEILRESVDARRGVALKYAVAADVGDALGQRLLRRGFAQRKEPEEAPFVPGSQALRGRPVVAGFGPCGIFAALWLARHGYRPIVLERGRDMAGREADFSALRERGVLNPESNICFGAGGAGAFSDGKLTARTKDGRARLVLDALIAHGADPAIGYQAKPHLGTENVRRIVLSLEAEIIRLGGEVCYGARLTGLGAGSGGLRSIVYVQEGQTYRMDCGALILAVGHSARDTLEMLVGVGVPVEPKAFAIGVRVEHRREMIDARQWGAYAGHPRLGAAEYRLTAEHGGRGVYSFCMCPGGEVVCSATEPGRTAVNGMSWFARDMENSNSAIVVSVRPSDMSGGPLGGIAMQREIEAAAYETAGGYGAVAQRFDDFAKGIRTEKFGSLQPSYRPYTAPGDLNAILPGFICQGIRAGFAKFERELPGFAAEGLLVGTETRTSCPVRLPRGADMQSVGMAGLYPAGEGAGYAGGIVSSAVDGIRAAQAVMARYAPPGGG